MKTKIKKESFSPVTLKIIFETEKEIQEFKTALASIDIKFYPHINAALNGLYINLKNILNADTDIQETNS